MTSRWLGALVLVMAGLLGAMWYSASAFTIARSVVATPPDFDVTAPAQLEMHDVHVRCGDRGDHYVSDSGNTMFFNGSTWSYPSEAPLCDAARSDRRTTSVAIVLASVLGALAILADGRMRQRRRQLGGPLPSSVATDVSR